MASRLSSILILLAFAASAILLSVLIERHFKEAPEEERHIDLIAHLPQHGSSSTDVSLPNFSVSDKSIQGSKVRHLNEFYSRRAYPGAPPIIPHPGGREYIMADDCLSCHEKGGFVPKYNAYAPPSPHPEKSNCRQCHVPQSGSKLFVESSWFFPVRPKLGQSALGGSPPRIPHSLQMRDNCRTCHTGPASVIEVRCSHPERENCQQCHVPVNNAAPFSPTHRLTAFTDAKN